MERHYPVSRIKVNQKFRRGILLDNGTVFILGQKENYQLFKTSLIKILSEIFYIDILIIASLVDSFLSSN